MGYGEKSDAADRTQYAAATQSPDAMNVGVDFRREVTRDFRRELTRPNDSFGQALGVAMIGDRQ